MKPTDLMQLDEKLALSRPRISQISAPSVLFLVVYVFNTLEELRQRLGCMSLDRCRLSRENLKNSSSEMQFPACLAQN